MGLLAANGIEMKFNQLGIGAVETKVYADERYDVTEDFMSDSQVSLTGVVYQDLNQDGFYQPGEELAGVTITPSSGNYTAVTSTSGGFVIPIDPAANVPLTVTASGGALGAGVTKTITTTGNNIKLDFTAQPVTPTPLTVSVVTAQGTTQTPAEFSITRSGNLGTVLELPYKMKGTAVNGVDYGHKNGILEFPAGVTTETLKIKSKMTDPNDQKTVTLKIKKSPVSVGKIEASVTITQ